MAQNQLNIGTKKIQKNKGLKPIENRPNFYFTKIGLKPIKNRPSFIYKNLGLSQLKSVQIYILQKT